jgi:5-deoxy-D-glucuronate isomerase
MGYTLLLDKTNAPLEHLSLSRLSLDTSHPYVTVRTLKQEAVLYSLTGTAMVYANEGCLGTIGGRKKITDDVVQCIRFPAGTDFVVSVLVSGFAADFLWITSSAVIPATNKVPYLHFYDVLWHDVGTGTHQRKVAEVPTPEGYTLFCGETQNIVGGISSWPPHATAEDVERFANGETTWEEVMWFACEKPCIANLKGVYTGNVVVNKLVELANGAAQTMCLGSHSIHAAPDSSAKYVWIYRGSALQKAYNRASTDLGTYLR